MCSKMNYYMDECDDFESKQSLNTLNSPLNSTSNWNWPYPIHDSSCKYIEVCVEHDIARTCWVKFVLKTATIASDWVAGLFACLFQQWDQFVNHLAWLGLKKIQFNWYASRPQCWAKNRKILKVATLITIARWPTFSPLRYILMLFISARIFNVQCSVYCAVAWSVLCCVLNSK